MEAGEAVNLMYLVLAEFDSQTLHQMKIKYDVIGPLVTVWIDSKQVACATIEELEKEQTKLPRDISRKLVRRLKQTLQTQFIGGVAQG